MSLWCDGVGVRRDHALELCICNSASRNSSRDTVPDWSLSSMSHREADVARVMFSAYMPGLAVVAVVAEMAAGLDVPAWVAEAWAVAAWAAAPL